MTKHTVRKRTRKELLHNRLATNRAHATTTDWQPLVIVNRPIPPRPWWALYPHSSTRQRARYARQILARQI